MMSNIWVNAAPIFLEQPFTNIQDTHSYINKQFLGKNLRCHMIALAMRSILSMDVFYHLYFHTFSS